MTNLEAIFPVNRHALYTKQRYPAAIRSGVGVFVSGQLGSRADGSAKPDDENHEALAFDNLIALPKAAGCSLNDVVDVTFFRTGPTPSLQFVIGSSPIYLFRTGRRSA
ncbi:Rid family hydrolase [Cypionkella sp. TWP1-2-1b2]|uniref:Rid family hydrolase n=1 Tax=Cypionkella sp. TWP1-2-1b2 TaxID=2804675 RepID=UPI003CF5BD2F